MSFNPCRLEAPQPQQNDAVLQVLSQPQQNDPVLKMGAGFQCVVHTMCSIQFPNKKGKSFRVHFCTCILGTYSHFCTYIPVHLRFLILSSSMSLRVATFRHTPHYFLCRQCLGNDNQTHIAETVSFEAREFGEDGVYLGFCIFKNLVNVRTIENQAADNLQVVCCVRCSVILGSKFVQLPPLFADRRGPFFHLNMDTVRYWDGNNSLAAEEGLPPMIAEAGQGEADPLHDPGHEAQVQADAGPDNLGEDDIDEHLPGA